MGKEWKYGPYWEEFPIDDGEIWRAGNNLVICSSILNGEAMSRFFKLTGPPAMCYVDPPWNQGNISSFYTKAKLIGVPVFGEFTTALLVLMKRYVRGTIFMEMGKQNVEEVEAQIVERGGTVFDVLETTYYKKHPSRLICFSFESTLTLNQPELWKMNGEDDEHTPAMAIKAEGAKSVVDFCCGRGLTGRTAHKNGVRFFGVELNKRRLANLLDFYNRQGLKPERIA